MHSTKFVPLALAAFTGLGAAQPITVPSGAAIGKALEIGGTGAAAA